MKDTASIRFLEEAAPKDDSGNVYHKGSEYTMSLASCEHWVKRGKAEYVNAIIGKSEPVNTVSPQAHIVKEETQTSPPDQEQEKQSEVPQQRGRGSRHEPFAKGEDE